ncbi:MAG TPA: TolC family protein [Bryobacteraceae bacterium]|jgi:outer membrane protein TolC|nr:TolC family protein [Bryobacteraceae bacterium]
MRPIYLLLLAPALAMAVDPVPLSLKRAVDVAISPEGSARIQLADEALKQAQARALEQRASLLPNVDAAFSDQSRTENLAALGFNPAIFSAIPIPGFGFDTFVGPFTTVDARVTGTQNVFDFSLIRKYQASKVGVTAARSDASATQEQVAAQVARAYLAAVKGDTDVDTAQSNVTLSQALLQQSEHEKEAGTGTGIEITRAKVQLANDRQRLLVAQNARRSAHLQLLRAINMRLDTDLQLTDKLQYVPVDALTMDAAKAQALKERPDLKAQEDRETNARLSASASKLERLPSLSAFGDYGDIGTSLTSAVPTRTVGIQVRVPLFDGGRRDARRQESASQYRAETVRTSDLKQQIELDVRLSLDSLQTADQEVKVAQEGLELANNELTQARRRYDAGVAVSVEVTDAQTRLERARDNTTEALYNYNLARLDLAQAMGRVRATLQ